MDKVLTCAEMRTADKYTIDSGTPSEELMRRAGAAIAEEVGKVAKRGDEILVVCGTGNNGGDGYVCARLLAEDGYSVKVYAVDGRLSEDCAREKERYKGGYSHDICGAIIVDCLFGTGLCREVTGELASVIDTINSSGAYIISADIPSGLCGDSGAALGVAVKADVTVAVAEYKTGMFLGDGIDYCGRLVKRDIGITVPDGDCAVMYSDGDIRGFYPWRRRNSHKGTYGTAELVVGSDGYIGAACLAAESALKSGCGYVKLVSTDKVKLALAARLPQVIYADETDCGADAIAVGSGCGLSESLYAKIARLAAEYTGSLIVDADGLNALARYGKGILKNTKCGVLITPHVKEFSRLTGESVADILAAPVKSAQAFARDYGVTVLLKGAATVITDGKRTAINSAGSTALAKAGSGDMLTGYICGSVARGLTLFDGAVCAAYTLGKAAEIASAERTDYCATARDIMGNLHKSVAKLLTSV